MPEPIVFATHERPEVEVQYRRPGELSSHTDTFQASEVRTDAVDRGERRT